jgi:hypothetical protein
MGQRIGLVGLRSSKAQNRERCWTYSDLGRSWQILADLGMELKNVLELFTWALPLRAWRYYATTCSILDPSQTFENNVRRKL